jgi:hypothetical protein
MLHETHVPYASIAFAINAALVAVISSVGRLMEWFAVWVFLVRFHLATASLPPIPPFHFHSMSETHVQIEFVLV